MASGNITILVGTTKGAFLISGGSDPQRLDGNGSALRRLAMNGHPALGDAATGVILGRRRRRLARCGRLALGGRRRELARSPG